MKSFFLILLLCLGCDKASFRGDSNESNTKNDPVPLASGTPVPDRDGALQNLIPGLPQKTIDTAEGQMVGQDCSLLYKVPAKASPFFAGSPAGSSITYSVHHDNKTDTQLVDQPVQVVPTSPLCLKPGGRLTFTVNGGIHHGGGSASVTGDGEGGIGSHQKGSVMQKSDMTAPLSSLVAVFLGDGLPASAPEAFDFGNETARNYDIINPKIGQIFFIGDGKNAAGKLQFVRIPEGTTRLFFAIWDSAQWNNNGGELEGQIVWTP